MEGIRENQSFMKSEKSKKEKKRPPSAFLLFSKDIRKKISQACPYFSPLDVSKVISEQWKTLPEIEKMRYREASSKLQEEANMKIINKMPSPTSYIPAFTIQYVPSTPAKSIIEKEPPLTPLPSITSFGNLVAFKDLNYISVTSN